MQNKKDELAELRELLFKYLNAWKWFVLSISVCLVIAFGYMKYKDPVYKVNANILVKEEDSGGIKSTSSMMKNFGFGFPGSMDANDELYVLSSFSIMRQAVDSLKLNIEYIEKQWGIKKIDRYGESVLELQAPSSLKDTFEKKLAFYIDIKKGGRADVVVRDNKNNVVLELEEQRLPIEIDLPIGNFRLVETALFDSNKSYNYQVTYSGLDEIAENLRKEIDVRLADKKSNVLSLSISGTNVLRNKRILDTLIFLYNQDALIEKNYIESNTSRFIKDRLLLLSSELEVAESAVEKFKIKNDIFDLSEQSKTMLEQSSSLQSAILDVTTQISIIDQLYEMLNRADSTSQLLPVNIGLKGDDLIEAIVLYNKAVLDKMQLMQTSYLNNPVLISLEEKISALKQNVLHTINNAKSSLLISENNLNKQLQEFYRKFKDAPSVEKQFLDIKRVQMIKEQLVLFLMEKNEENALALAVTAPKAKIVDNAYKENLPISPKKIIILIIALGIGLVIPIIVIFVQELFVTTFANKEELERLVDDIPIIGEICKMSSSSEKIVVKEGEVTSVAELFRLIRTNMQFIMTRKEDQSILITSTQSGEGKSFFSLNMALSLALAGKKVVLVGLDIRSPKLAEYLDIKSHLGVTNYLSNDSLSYSDILIPHVHHPNLDVIIAGPVPPNPGELLLSERLDQLFVELRAKYDYILIDSAPVGMVSDSFVLDRLSDMTLYVTRANYTDRKSLNFIKYIYKQSRLKRLYLVINATSVKKGYGYGYGYGYQTNEGK